MKKRSNDGKMIEIETPELNVKFKWPADVVVVVAGAAR